MRTERSSTPVGSPVEFASMDQITRFLLLSTLVPASIAGIVAVWTLWVSRRQREREADRRDLLDALEQTKRDVAAGIRFLVRTGERRRIEDVELLLFRDSYAKSDLALIGDAATLNVYLDFEARILAYAGAGECFPDDLLLAGRMVGGFVYAAVDEQYKRARAGKPIRQLSAEERRMIEPDELYARRVALDRQVTDEVEARRNAMAEQKPGLPALVPEGPSVVFRPE
jgi:hypothetical protein